MMVQAMRCVGSRRKLPRWYQPLHRARTRQGSLTFAAAVPSTIKRRDWITLQYSYKTILHRLPTLLLTLDVRAAREKRTVWEPGRGIISLPNADLTHPESPSLTVVSARKIVLSYGLCPAERRRPNLLQRCRRAM